MKFNAGQQFENPPAGNHIARCYGLVDLGTQKHPGFQGGPERMSRDVRINFELPNEKMEGIYNPECKGRVFSVSTTVKQSLHPKARLTALLTGWRGKAFTKEDIEKFDPRGLLGKPCRLTLVQNDAGYINIESISPLGKIKDAKGKAVFEPCPKQVNKTVYFSLEPDEFDQKVFDALHEKTREKIMATPEWAALTEPAGAEAPQADAPPDVPEHAPDDQPPSDDDVPF